MEIEQYVGCVLGPRSVPVPIIAGQRLWDTGHECCFLLSVVPQPLVQRSRQSSFMMSLSPGTT